MQKVSALKTKEEINYFLTTAKNIDTRYDLLIRIGITTGLRISDILSIRIKDIKNGGVTVREAKTGKIREVKFDKSLLLDIKRHKRSRLMGDDYLIFSSSKHHDKPMSRVRAWQIIKSISSSMPSNIRYNENYEHGTHSLRKTYAQNLYRANKDVLEVQEELNHKYLSTTLLYLLDKDVLDNLPI